MNEDDNAHSSSIDSRIHDLHDAFLDPKVKAILTVIGGFNSNQLLDAIDWDIIRSNPKIFCGYSDITALSNALFAKTGLMTYVGPHYSTFGQKHLSDYTVDYVKKCLFDDDTFTVLASKAWTDDRWYKDQNNRQLIENAGHWILQPGQAKGVIIGDNLSTYNLLQGTSYEPSVDDDVIAFFEDDASVDLATFDRDLESFLQTKLAERLKGLVIGRFQVASNVAFADLQALAHDKPRLQNIPIIANVDFGHTDPMVAFPIGGTARVNATESVLTLTIERH